MKLIRKVSTFLVRVEEAIYYNRQILNKLRNTPHVLSVEIHGHRVFKIEVDNEDILEDIAVNLLNVSEGQGGL